jgi:starvation-inducible outer membrane lipoprotein
MRILPAMVLLMLAGCAAQTDAITAGGSQVELRQIQTREYDTLDKRGTLRSVVATLQDLGFVIDKADYELGTISATKLQHYEIRMTVTVREREGKRLAVRANAGFNEKPIEDSQSYQDFFTALDKAMFLTLHKVD